MKALKLSVALFTILAAGLTGALAAESKPAPCCAKAAQQGKTCTHACCVEAAKLGYHCVKCNGSGKIPAKDPKSAPKK